MRRQLRAVIFALLGTLSVVVPAAAQERLLGREEILLYGVGLKVEPAQQTVPKDFATIVSTFLQAPTLPPNAPAFAPDAEVRATLRGPSFPTAIELVARPNQPLNIPLLTVSGRHTVENIRLVSGGQVLLYGSPEVATIDVIEKLLVTTVTTRALTADEIREKGIVYDKSNFQAYNFTAAFAIDDGSQIKIEFPVLLPTLPSLADVNPSAVDFRTVDAPQLHSLKTLIPDTLKIQARIPNLSVVGFTLTLDGAAASQDFYVPPIPGVIVIPGDIGFLNQFFSVMLMVGNVAPTGSNLVVSHLTASLVLPPGADRVVGSLDDPLAMALRAGGEFPRVAPVTQPGPDGKLGTGDDITTLGPGETGNAEYLVEGRREGTHVVEMELLGTLNGLPVGPVPIRGRAAGAVLVRNPTFTLTFTHPEVVNAREPYTLDVTVTNTSESPANFVSVNLFPANITGAALDDDAVKSVDAIAPGDSETVTFRLISNKTGKVTAATLDSDSNVQGRFVLKSAVGELGAPLSPDSFVLPSEASALDPMLRQTAVDLMARAWAVATAPPAALPKDLSRFSKQVVLDRGVETAEAGLRVSLGESMPRAASALLFDFLGSEYSQLASRVPANDQSGLLALLQRDVRGFDLVRRLSVRGGLFADAVAALLAPDVRADATAFHRAFAEQMTSRPGHVSVLVRAANGGSLGVDARLVDGAGRRVGGVDGVKALREIPFGDVLSFKNLNGNVTAQWLIIAVPSPETFTLELTPRSGADQQTPYDLTVVLPGPDGKLRFASLNGLSATDGFNLTNGGAPPASLYAVRRDATGGATATAALTLVNDPPPTILGVRQVPKVDMVGCPLDPERSYPAGRVVAVLFSEEVTPQSVQDKAGPGHITTFTVENNRAVGVALQPGGRIAYVALRSPIGPFESRMMTVEGAQDLNGNTIPAQTLPIQTVVGTAGGSVYGQVLRADGSPAAFSTVRMFYEFSCTEGPTLTGIAEQTTDAGGSFEFDYVLRAPGMTVKLVALDEERDDIRTVRFALARDGQRLNTNVVFIGRGSVTGRTLAEDGRTALPGTQLRATSLTDQSQYGATSDSDGRYGFAGVPVGNLLIEAVNTVRPASVFVSENLPFAGAVVTRDIVLLDVATTAPIKRGTVTGRVVRADGSTAVAGVPVIAYYKNRSQPNLACPIPPGGTHEPAECALDVVNSTGQGLFEFAALAAGEIRLNTFDQGMLQEGNVRLTLLENQTVDATVLLGGGFGTVHGVVLNASRQPVPDAVIGGGGSLVNAGPDGRFTLTDIPVGRTRLVAVSNALQTEGQTVVDIVQNGEAVNATIVLEPIGSVAGVVRNHDGVPQAGIKVWVFQDCFDELEQPSICVKGEATTNAQGAYRIDKLGVAQYRISAFTADLKDGNVVPIAIRYERQVLVADLTFRGGLGTVKGRVLRAENCQTQPCGETPLPAKVSISGDRLVVAGGQIGVKWEYVQNFKVVDNDFTTGEYEFKNQVYTGAFTVRAAGQFSPEPVAAEGTMPGPGQTVTIDLRLQPTSRVTGTVFEADGFTPVTSRQVALKFKSDAVVVFCNEDSSTGDSECTTIPQGIQEAFAATDSQGQFTFPIVNAGPFTITATDDTTRQVAEIKGTVRAGDVFDVPVRLLDRAAVTVVVRSSNQVPIVGATVELQGIEYPKERRIGVTGPGGILQFAGGDAVSEGQFIVTAMSQGGFAGRKSGRVVANGSPVHVDVFLFDATGTITGQVLRENAAAALVPVPNAEVILSNATGPLAYAVSDAQGAYTVPLVPTGEITAEGFDPVTASRGRATAVVLGGTQPTSLTVTLEALGSIRGTVVQAGSLAPLKGWTVQLSASTFGGRALPTQIAQTGVDGSFSFPGAPVGNFHLQAFKRGIVGQTSANGQVARGGQLVDVPLAVNIVRRVAGTVAGTVVLPGGAPAPSAQVEICGGDGCRAVVGDNEGRFSLADIPLGRFTVRASAQVTGSPSVGTTGGALLFEGDVADLTVTLLGLSVVEGTVFETQNNQRVPALNATVRLYGQPGSGCSGACQQGTDANGRFRFINVPAQTFTVVASTLTGQQGSIGDVLTPGQTKSGLEIVLAPSVTMTGRVLLANGSPAGAVVVDLSLNGGHLFAETASDGSFSFDAIGAGNYSLFLRDPVGGGLARKSGAVALGGPLALGDLTLDEAPPAVVESTPASGATGVSRRPEIHVRFSEPVTVATVNPTNVTLLGPTGPVVGLIDTLDNDTDVRFRLLPGADLADQARYTLRVAGVTDRAGRPMAADFVATFTTVDVTAPTTLETTPTTTATGVSPNTTIRIKFNEIIDPSKFVGAPIRLSGPQGVVAGRIDYLFSDTVVVFTPNLPLAEDTAYTVSVQAATDLTGLKQAAGADFGFTTTDRTPPVIGALTVAGNGSLVRNTIGHAAVQVATTDISVVDFFINDTFAFADRVAPFAMEFLVSGAPGSQLTISAVATDTSGNRGLVPVSALVTVIDDLPPAVIFTAPTAALSPAPGERVNVSVRATDDVGVKEISYSARGSFVIDAATRTVAPPSLDRAESFAFNVPVDAVPGSLLTLQASAKDTGDHLTPAATLELRIRDTVGPTVTITGVSSGQRVLPGARVTAVVSASDTSRIARIGFVVSGITVSTETRDVTPLQSPVATSFEFVVPAGATSSDRVNLDAFAIDGAGNRSDAARLILPVADQQPPIVTLRTSTGALTMVPGGTVDVIVEGADDLALAGFQLTGAGAFTYSDARSLAVPSANAAQTFTLSIPATIAEGATEVLTARATDASGNPSVPVSITLTTHVTEAVTLPPSLLLLAGRSGTLAVTLGAPAPSGGVRVDLQSHDSGVATVTASLTFTEGETAKSATVLALSGGSTQLDALIGGVLRATTTVTVSGGVVDGEVVETSPQGLVPVAGAQITVFHGGTPITTVSDAQGRFQVVGVIGGDGLGRAFSVGASDGTRLGFVDDELDVRGGSANVTVILLQVGAITGTVRRSDGTAVGAQVKVDLFEAASPSVIIATAFTDAAGRYRFPLVAPGQYRLEASDLSGNRGRSNATVATSGEEVNVDVVYLGRGLVTVHVVDGQGASVSGASIELRANGIFGSSPLRTTNTNASGDATFADVFVGSVSVTARDQFSSQAGAASGLLAADGATLALNVAFTPYSHLTGTVFRADGTTPVVGAAVTVDCGSGCRFTGPSDANGVYRFEFLPLRPFTLTVFDPGTRGRAIENGALSVSGQTVTRHLTLLPQGALLVSVLDADGNPVNGASVSASTTNQGLTDNLQGTTAVVNGSAGQLLLNQLLAGPFTVNASASGLNGSATGTLSGNDVHPVTVRLEARATIAGTVFEPDGQTPAAGSVRIYSPSAQVAHLTLTNGTFSLPDLRLGTYSINAYDAANRLRAKANSIVLSANGQVAPVALTLVGIGTVQGRVIHPTGGAVGLLGVDLRSLNSDFGGFAHVSTDAAGNFVFNGVVVGPVSLTSGKPAEQLLGEAAGTLAQHNQAITLDILLQTNAVNLPVNLSDVQSSTYQVAANGGLFNGTGSVFSPQGTDPSVVNQGTVLTLASGATSATFPNAAFGTQEDAGREIAVRRDDLLGLNVIRKVFVPQTGYFARYLEVLQNPTSGPITVDVRVDSGLYGGRNQFCSAGFNCYSRHFVLTTSSGDSTVTPTDRWVSLGAQGGDPFSSFYSGTPLAFVFAGANAPVPATTATFSSGATSVQTNTPSSMRYGWGNVTVPANSTVTLMHFVSEQASYPGATASAQRLGDLPPEALAGLSQSEIATISNFVVPADGSSAVAPLPAIDGVITGRVLEGDAATPVSGATVTFSSGVALFARQQRATSNAAGDFTFTGVVGAPIPLADFTLTATHPSAQFTTTPVAAAAFANGQTTIAQNVSFSDRGVLKGVVRRHTGLPVSGASVVMDGSRFTQTAVDGRFFFGGVFAGAHAITGSVNHGQGTSLNFVARTFTVAAGQVVDDVVVVEPTGTITGTVRDANGAVQAGRSVTLTRGGFSRFVNATGSDGRFTFTDVPLGTFTATSSDPVSGFPVSQQVTIAAADQIQDVTLNYLGKGSLTVTVTRSTGVLIQGMSVTVSAPGMTSQVKTSDASGVAGPFTDLPLGQTFTIVAVHPELQSIIRAERTLLLSAGSATTALTLPAFGTGTATVTQPHTTARATGVPISVLSAANSTFKSGTTSVGTNVTGGLFNMGVIPVGTPFVVRATRAGGGGVPTYTYTTPPMTLLTDGQVLDVATHIPAVAALSITVRGTNGALLPGARIETRDSNSGSFFSPRGATNASGVLSVPNLPEGTVAIRVLQPAPNNNVLELTTATIAPADHGSTIPVQIGAKAFSVTVIGRTMEADGVTPLQGVEIQPFRAIDGVSVAFSVCSRGPNCGNVQNPADRGTFSIGPLTSTGAGLTIRARVVDQTVEIPIVPTENGTIDIGAVTMAAYTVTLDGHVYAADGVTPVTSGYVVPVRLVGNSGGFVSTVGPDGRYQAAPQVYPSAGMRLEFSLPGLLNGKHSVNTVPFTQSGQTVTTDIVLPASVFGTVQGTVVAADGSTPIPGATVDVIFPAASCTSNPATPCSNSTTADAHGNFTFALALPSDGQFLVRAHSPRTFSIVGEVSGSATQQGGMVNVGNVTVPVTMLAGVATNGPTALVGNLTAFVKGSDSSVRFADQTPGDGTFRFFELSADDYQLTVEDNDSGTRASLPVTLAAGGVVTGVHVELPRVARVEVRVIDQNGFDSFDATVTLTKSGGAFERFEYDTELGRYVFRGVALGDYTVQARVDTCEDVCVSQFAYTTLSVVDENTVQVTLNLNQTAEATVAIRGWDGNLLSGHEVTIAVQPLAGGPLGDFINETTMVTNGAGQVHLSNLPLGPFVMRVTALFTFVDEHDPGDPDDDTEFEQSATGSYQGTATAGDPLEFEVPLSFDTLRLDDSFFQGINSGGVLNRFWVIDKQPNLRDAVAFTGSTNDGNAFYQAVALQVQSQQVCCALTGVYTQSNNELTFSPVGVEKVPGVVATRRMRVLQNGAIARVLDTLVNTTSTTQTFTVSHYTRTNKSDSLVMSATPSTSTGGYVVLEDTDSSNRGASFAVVYSGVDPHTPLGLELISEIAGFTVTSGIRTPVTLTLAPGQHVSLLNYVVAAAPNQSAAVLVKAQALAAGTEPQMLLGLSRTDIERIVNFRITPPPPGPAELGVTVSDSGNNRVRWAKLALFGNGFSQIKSEFQTDNSDVYRFSGVPAGTYTLQASLNTCDRYPCTTLFTEQQVTLGADEFAATHVAFNNLGRARIVVTDGYGPPLAWEQVEVEIRSLSVGPLGQDRLGPGEFTTSLDQDGVLALDQLPPGPFHVSIYSPRLDRAGFAQATATRVLPTLGELQLRGEIIRMTNSAIGITGGDNYQFVIDSFGQIAQVYPIGGQNGAFEYAAQMHEGADTEPLCCSLALETKGREFLLTPVALPQSPGVTVARRMFLPQAGGFMRVYDVLTNTSATTRDVQIANWTKPLLSANAVADVTPSATTGGYFVRNGQAESFAVVYAGVDPVIAPAMRTSDDGTILQPTTTVSLAPGQRVALLQFVVVRAPDAAADAQAAAIALATLANPDALAGLTRPELALIANFRIALPPPGPMTIRVRVVRPDGSVTEDAAVALAGESYSQQKEAFDTIDGAYEFASLSPGAYVAQARLEQCEAECTTLFAEAAVTAVADTNTEVVIRFSALRAAVLRVLGEDGQPLPGRNVDVQVRSLAAVGRLGSYQRNFNVDLDGNGAVSLGQLPPGQFVVQVVDATSGVIGVTIATAGAPPPLVHVRLDPDVYDIGASGLSLWGDDLFMYGFNGYGAVDRTYFLDQSDPQNSQWIQTQPFAFAAEPHSSHDSARPPVCCPVAATNNNGEVTMTPVPVADAQGVLMTRRLRLPQTGGFVRFLDVFTNTSNAPRTIDISNWTKPQVSNGIAADVTPSSTTGGYFAAQSPAGEAFSWAVVYAGVNPPLLTERVLSDDQSVFEPKTSVVIAPGQSVSLLHFLLLRAATQVGDVVVAADETSALTDENLLVGLSPADLTSIVNFRVP